MNAIFCLNRASYDLIYGEEERADIRQLVNFQHELITADELSERPEILIDIDFIFSGWGGPVLSKDILDCAPNLKAVFYGAGSVKYMMTDAFWERQVAITSAYAANAIPVVEYTLGQILFGLKSGWQHVWQCRKEQTFSRLPMASGYGSTVGLISLGMIGKMVAERLKTFDVKIIAYDPFVGEYPGVDMLPLAEVFRRADVVSVHTPWLKETEGLITGELIASMKPYSTFLNTSRGAVICENEMIEVLERREDLAAVLDVTWPEPPSAGSKLYTLPNVILTPHIAGSVGPECRRMGRVMVDELKRFLAGERLLYGLTREKVALMA